MILEYAGVEYNNVMYSCGPAPTYDRSSWTNVKNTLGLDFPNLPYYIDGKEEELFLLFIKFSL